MVAKVPFVCKQAEGNCEDFASQHDYMRSLSVPISRVVNLAVMVLPATIPIRHGSGVIGLMINALNLEFSTAQASCPMSARENMTIHVREKTGDDGEGFLASFYAGNCINYYVASWMRSVPMR